MFDFYTIGLPRSRSLWLSKLLSYGDSTAFHEHLSMPGSEQRPQVDTKYRGFCDTNPLVSVDYGKSPVLKVLRDKDDVVMSALRCFDQPQGVKSFGDFLQNYADEYDAALKKINAKKLMVVRYDELGCPKTVQKICRFLMPDNPVPIDHIVEMIGTRVQTTNRSLTESLRMTAAAQGIKYKELIERYDKPTYVCVRLTDYQQVISVMNEMWDDVSEDGAPPYIPDIINEYWVGIFTSSMEFLGMFRMHQHTSAMWEGHIFILPEQRHHAKTVGDQMKAWIKTNLPDAKRIIANVPECFPNVMGFLQNNGFEEQGYSPNSYQKRGLIGIYQYGMNTEDM